MDKLTQALLVGLKQALQEPGEQRLFRSGKLPGVFAGKTGLYAEAAALALRDGLLEITRQETKGKTTTEWVKPTPRGVEFVHLHESPVQAVRELRAEIETLSARLAEQNETTCRLIEGLSQRVVETLQRLQASGSKTPAEASDVVAWGPDALAYLDKRGANWVSSHCAMPELFAALRDKYPEMTVVEFHGGLRKLHDRGVLRLLAYEGTDPLPQPEYALLDGAVTYYHVGQ
jgi:hypothetical protein